MPTGYTADITKDTTLEEFAMKCARAFGALILMRDDPQDAEIPEFKPSDWHEKELAKATARIAELTSMTASQCDAEADKAWSASAKGRIRSKAESDKKRAAYQAVLARVQAWTPPTPEHEGLKTFMAKQLAESIEFDCIDDATVDLFNPLAPVTGAEWRENEMKQAKQSVVYHANENAKEIARAKQRNKWVRDLRDSLRK